MGDDANGGCCTLKRGSGIFILVLSIISLVGTVICAVIASATEMGLYAAFNWIHFVLLIYLISAASAYVCCRACGSKVTGGLAVGYCVLAFVTFIVVATGQQSAMEHYCEGTVECASISDWGDHDPECGHKTSSFSLCYLPETDGRRRRLASSYAPETDERRRRLATGCRSDICTDIGNDCCAPGGEARGCSLAGYEVEDDWVGSSGWSDCVGSYGQQSVYQCCSNDVTLFKYPVVSWYEPADGVPLSGLESSQACESRGQRLCLYDELCPSGEDTAPVNMPSSHSDWMPFLSTTYGRRWMTGGLSGSRGSVRRGLRRMGVQHW